VLPVLPLLLNAALCQVCEGGKSVKSPEHEVEGEGVATMKARGPSIPLCATSSVCLSAFVSIVYGESRGILTAFAGRQHRVEVTPKGLPLLVALLSGYCSVSDSMTHPPACTTCQGQTP